MKHTIDIERPQCHVSGPRGFLNDPNGPLFFKGYYHLFFQSLPDSVEWTFGVEWGHCVSSDLVHWKHLPSALKPTPGGYDADGCFSGCAAVDSSGTPTILYTGVRLRNNPDVPPPPNPLDDIGLPFIESQLCAAQGDPDDPLLQHWTKVEACPVPMPPEELRPASNLTGWRDPFIFELPGKIGTFEDEKEATMGEDHEQGGNVGAHGSSSGVETRREWGMLMGNGIKNRGGCVMVYRSADITSGWRYVGMLCSADSEDHGAMWECPVLLPLRTLTHSDSKSGTGTGDASAQPIPARGPVIASLKEQAPDGGLPVKAEALKTDGNATEEIKGKDVGLDEEGGPTHVLFISPDAPIYPVLYWLGRYQDDDSSGCPKFVLESAVGPYQLDLGDILYAVNVVKHADSGHHILWGWLQEAGGRRTYYDFCSRKLKQEADKGRDVEKEAARGYLVTQANTQQHEEEEALSPGASASGGGTSGDGESYNYSGCLSVPREVWVRGGVLVQRPATELAGLREEVLVDMDTTLTIPPNTILPIQGTGSTPTLELHLTLHRGDATSAGFWIPPWVPGAKGGTAIVYDWESDQLEACFGVYEVDMDAGTVRDASSGTKASRAHPSNGGASHAYFGGPHCVGGVLGLAAGQPLELTVLLDGSCLEVFTSAGPALSTRVYRGRKGPAHGTQSSTTLALISLGGATQVSQVRAWQLSNCWLDREAEAAAPCPQPTLEIVSADYAVDMEWGTVKAGRCKGCQGFHRKEECPAGIESMCHL